MQDVLIAAAAAAIPPGLLALLRAGRPARSKAAAGGRSGAWQQAAGRGRPAGVRAAAPSAGQRLHLIETLRAAAPWQRLRREALPPHAPKPRLAIRASDFRVIRYRQRRTSTTLFVVDASGSAALNRLAEAKGAVELLLADCYVRRDRVALIGFRGAGAELLLPPTRSLVRAKRSLAGLPGGGGTPLAHAIDAAGALADAVARRGETPTAVFLTDGRANIALDGTPGRAKATEDATAAARRFCALGHDALWLDTAPQPQAAARELALAMGARYVALPYAAAADMSRVVRAATASR
jgi:magnesium chelatase subunit D